MCDCGVIENSATLNMLNMAQAIGYNDRSRHQEQFALVSGKNSITRVVTFLR